MLNGRLREGARLWAPSLVASCIALALLCAVFAAPVARAAQQPKPRVGPIVVEVQDGGFHWGDAAIGAGAAIGVVCVAESRSLQAARRPADGQPLKPAEARRFAPGP